MEEEASDQRRCSLSARFFSCVLPSIHRSAWKGNSANFAFIGFSEVRRLERGGTSASLRNRTVTQALRSYNLSVVEEGRAIGKG
jgi:hypothetical protein